MPEPKSAVSTRLHAAEGTSNGDAVLLLIHTLSKPIQSGMDEMMSRGIDPDVGNPQKYHSHPEVPDKWPSNLLTSCPSLTFAERHGRDDVTRHRSRRGGPAALPLAS